MASIATVYNKVLAPLAPAARVEMAADNQYALRALPNEDLYLFHKTFDNGAVVRRPDPATRANYFKLLLTGTFAVLLFLGVLLPAAASRIANAQIAQLDTDRQRLEANLAVLEVEESAQKSPQKALQYAQEQQFENRGDVRAEVFLEGKSGSLAMVKK